MHLDHIQERLQSRESSIRAVAWMDLYLERRLITSDDLRWIFRSLRLEKDATVHTTALTIALEVLANQFVDSLPQKQAGPSPVSLQEFLWSDFLETPDDDRDSLVVAISDMEHFNDTQSVTRLARYLSDRDYPNVEFKFLPVEKANQDWRDLNLSHKKAACFLARPSMYGRLDWLPIGRFELPPDAREWRGKPISVVSRKKYHHLTDTCGIDELVAHEYVKDDKTHRVDYAVVRRVPPTHEHPTAILSVAGITSLGTFGASEWLTRSQKFNSELFGNLLREVADKKAPQAEQVEKLRSSDIEILLKVEAEVFTRPKRQWLPQVQVEKVCVNGKNLMRHIAEGKGPKRVTVDPEIPTRVFFDGDNIDVPNPTFYDVCLQLAQGKNIVHINEKHSKVNDHLRKEQLRSVLSMTVARGATRVTVDSRSSCRFEVK